MDKMERNTIKGHGFKVGDRIDYYGRDESATDQADRTILGKEGTVYILTVVGGQFHGTQVAKFGAATKIWAAPVADDSDNVEVKETTLDNGDTVYTATCEHGWATGFYTVAEDATKVARGHGSVSLPMYEAPEVTRELPAAPVKAFDESDPATWFEDNLPAGYVWAEMGGGEFHLFTPDNVNLSEAYYARQAARVVSVAVDDLVADSEDGCTYLVTRADEYWIGLRKVGTWREGRNIRTEDFRKHMADGALVNVSARLATPEERPSEVEVWAGTDTTITPGVKTLMNRRARKSSKRKNTRVNSRRVKGGF